MVENSEFFCTRVYLYAPPPLMGFLLKLCNSAWAEKPGRMWLPDREN